MIIIILMGAAGEWPASSAAAASDCDHRRYSGTGEDHISMIKA